MIPDTDIWHSVFYTQDGYVAILDLTDIPQVKVYMPNGEWCGCTGATLHHVRMKDVREIIAWNKKCNNIK